MNNKLIIDKGIYNNIDVMENTLESFKDAFDNNYIIKTKVQSLIDDNFILFEDDALLRLLNLKDNIKNISYDEIEYISEFNILKIGDFLNILENNTGILEITNLSKKVCAMLLKQIKKYNKNIIVLSMHIKILKLFRKNGFQVMLKIVKKNKMKINSYFKPDFYLIDNELIERKKIKKLREDYFVVANNVKKEEIKQALEIYDNVLIIN